MLKRIGARGNLELWFDDGSTVFPYSIRYAGTQDGDETIYLASDDFNDLIPLAREWEERELKKEMTGEY